MQVEPPLTHMMKSFQHDLEPNSQSVGLVFLLIKSNPSMMNTVLSWSTQVVITNLFPRTFQNQPFCICYNSKLIKNFGDSSLHKVKSDKLYAAKIARYTINSFTELRQYTLMDK